MRQSRRYVIGGAVEPLARSRQRCTAYNAGVRVVTKTRVHAYVSYGRFIFGNVLNEEQVDLYIMRPGCVCRGCSKFVLPEEFRYCSTTDCEDILVPDTNQVHHTLLRVECAAHALNVLPLSLRPAAAQVVGEAP